MAPYPPAQEDNPSNNILNLCFLSRTKKCCEHYQNLKINLQKGGILSTADLMLKNHLFLFSILYALQCKSFKKEKKFKALHKPPSDSNSFTCLSFPNSCPDHSFPLDPETDLITYSLAGLTVLFKETAIRHISRVHWAANLA